MAKVCEYYLAPQSPWTYLGHARFVALAKQYGVQVDIKPCDLGKVFNVSGGLPLAKRLVELHGGTLALESQVNSGTVVSVILPPDRMVDDPDLLFAVKKAG